MKIVFMDEKLKKRQQRMEILSVTTAPLNNSRYCANHTLEMHASDISSGELNTSPELGAYTPALFTSSSTRVLVPRLRRYCHQSRRLSQIV
jgi:hypothetical protein